MNVLFLSFALLAAFAAGSHFKINQHTETTSGISAGAFFAVQYQFAFSNEVKAAGIVAGGPMVCAAGQGLSGALDCINLPSSINLGSIDVLVSLMANDGTLDPLSNLPNRTWVLFSGLLDTVVPQATMTALVTQLNHFGVNRVKKIFDIPAEHSWITDMYGNACSTLGSPYINNCNLPFAKAFLKAAWSDLQLTFNSTKGSYVAGNMHAFDQVAFGANGFLNSMGNIGFYYVPVQCWGGSVVCHVHVNFHGCEQDFGTLGLEYVSQTEINNYAETNNIIVIYPQTTANELKENPKACFDWWGYDDSGYAGKNGTQMKMVRAMVAMVKAGRQLPPLNPTPSPPPSSPGPLSPPSSAPSPSGGPVPPPTTAAPSGPPSCAGRPLGSDCVNSHEYIVCPAGLTFQCAAGLTCKTLPNGDGACI